jgi:hypothetical protein
MEARSTTAFWHENPDGSTIDVRAYINGTILQFSKQFATLKESDMVDVVMRKDVFNFSIPSQAGDIATLKPESEIRTSLTLKEYKELIAMYWHEGAAYYDIFKQSK